MLVVDTPGYRQYRDYQILRPGAELSSIVYELELELDIGSRIVSASSQTQVVTDS